MQWMDLGICKIFFPVGMAIETCPLPKLLLLGFFSDAVWRRPRGGLASEEIPSSERQAKDQVLCVFTLQPSQGARNLGRLQWERL
jgi:hypothetical protein